MSSIRKAVVARWSYYYWSSSSIYQDNRTQSLYSIGAIEDLETFDDSRLRRNFASVICEGRCKASVVEHSLRPTASVQCKGDKAVSCGRKAATRASFPSCWGYMAHQCRWSRHRRAHSCCRNLTNARKDSSHCRKIGTVNRLSSTGRAEPEDCHSASAGSSGTPNIRPSMTRFANLRNSAAAAAR